MVQAKSSLVIGESCSDFPIGILRTFPRIIDQYLTARSKPNTQWQKEHAADNGCHVLDECQVKWSNSFLLVDFSDSNLYSRGHGANWKMPRPGSVVIKSMSNRPSIFLPRKTRVEGLYSLSTGRKFVRIELHALAS
jgi:hypothetical protein